MEKIDGKKWMTNGKGKNLLPFVVALCSSTQAPRKYQTL